jgi:glycosyltransferase 2 family protein
MALLRLALGLLLVAALIWMKLLDPAALVPALGHPGLLVIALLCLFAAICVAAVRWYVLLRVQRIHAPRLATWRAVISGAFLGTFLPGMLGGDLVRTGYIVRWAPHRISTGLLSILVDRALGLSGVMFVALLVLLAHPEEIPDATRMTIVAALGTLIAASIVVMGLARRIDKRLARPGVGPSTLAKWMHELAHAVTLYRHAPMAVAGGMLLSMIVCGFDILALLLVTKAIGITALPRVQQAIAGMLALIANAVPFTPGGLGIGEAAFANACIALERFASGAPYATAFLAFRCINILASVPGAFIGIPRTSKTS